MAENYRTPKRPHHQRAKSAIVRSILSSKTNAAHHELPSPSKKSNRGAPLDFTIYDQAGELTALGSPIDQNISLPWQSAENQQPSLETRRGRSRSITSMFARARSKSRVAETRLETGTSENSTGKPAPIVKPRNNFSGFLKRPKSFIGEASSNLAEKENTPPTPVDEHTPIWAQFATSSGMDAGVAPEGIYRPVSSHYSHKRSESKPDAPRPSNWSSSSSTSIPRSLHDSDHQRYQRLDPIVLEEQFEELLSQRNIPDAVKEQMRKLQPALKADFVRKAGVRGDSRPGSAEMAHPTMVAQRSGRPEPTPRPPESSKPKKAPRPKSWTLGFTRSAESKAQAIRGSDKGSSGDSNPMPLKSTMDKGTSDLQSIEKLGVGIIGKSRKVLPGEFVSYLSQKGSLASIEVGRLHKLRVLLRNESVEWVDEFMHLEGMDKLIKLLYRVTKVEWRDEHDDRIMHEALLCIKALCTTEMGQIQLSNIANIFFPTFLNLIFDPDRKGPSEFTTRGVLFGLLLTYLASADPSQKAQRAYEVLIFLNDSSFNQQPSHAFIKQMQSSRPYKTWCKEVTNVTKEVFWIFMHGLTVIPVTRSSGPSATPSAQSYQRRHFPKERIIVPAQPYVGGVEWDATNYLADHLDLLNALFACLPTNEERNAMRSELAISGFEQLMGKTLRTCKEKLYPSVHEALKTWVAAAVDDGWETKLVRQGPPRAERLHKIVGKDVPKIDQAAIPRLDLSDLRFE